MNGTAAANYIAELESQLNLYKSRFQNKVIEFEEYKKKSEEEKKILEEQLSLALYYRFGKHAEKYDPSQILLFDSAEAASPAAKEPEEKITVQYTRSKKGRKPLSDNIPRKETIIDIGEEEKTCACGHKLVCIGEDRSEKLCVIPRKIYVILYRILKYACKNCEGSGDEGKRAVRTGKIPGNIMPGSIATPELLSYVFTEKYCLHVPYYRQETAFRWIGAEVSRQNMSNWQVKSLEKISPLLGLIKEHIKSGQVINMDETPMQVMDEPGREDKQQSRMWLARGGPPERKATWYEYHPTRDAKYIVGLLEGYHGFLQTDGYETYETAIRDLPGITHVECWAHVRRKFFDADKAAGGSGDAKDGLELIQRLYAVEKVLRGLVEKGEIDELDFLDERKDSVDIILGTIHKWLLERQGKVLDSGLLGKAINYALERWQGLTRYLDNAEMTPDNNAAERGIRTFVMGRKNWVMSGSPEGAKTSCELYTLIQTAKDNGINPYDYLRTVFTQAADMKPTDDWSQLLPWNVIL